VAESYYMMKIYVATGAIILSFLNSEMQDDEYSTQATVTSNTLFFEEEFYSSFGSGRKCGGKNPCPVIMHSTFQDIPSTVPEFLQFSILYRPRLE